MPSLFLRIEQPAEPAGRTDLAIHEPDEPAGFGIEVTLEELRKRPLSPKASFSDFGTMPSFSAK